MFGFNSPVKCTMVTLTTNINGNLFLTKFELIDVYVTKTIADDKYVKRYVYIGSILGQNFSVKFDY